MANIKRGAGQNIQIDDKLKVITRFELPIKDDLSTDGAGSIVLKTNNLLSYKDNQGRIIEINPSGTTGSTATLQTATTGSGNNVTNNALQITGSGNLDVTKDGIIINNVGISKVSGGTQQGLYGFTNDSVILNYNSSSIALKDQTSSVAGAQVSTRISAQQAVNNNELPTLGQVITLVGTGSTSNLTFVNGLRKSGSTVKLGLDITDTGYTSGILTEDTYLFNGPPSGVTSTYSGSIIKNKYVELYSQNTIGRVESYYGDIIGSGIGLINDTRIYLSGSSIPTVRHGSIYTANTGVVEWGAYAGNQNIVIHHEINNVSGSSITIVDNDNSIGAVYAGDYSANFIDNSLVTKKFVLNSISGLTGSTGGTTNLTFANGLKLTGNTVRLGLRALSLSGSTDSGILTDDTYLFRPHPVFANSHLSFAITGSQGSFQQQLDVNGLLYKLGFNLSGNNMYIQKNITLSGESKLQNISFVPDTHEMMITDNIGFKGFQEADDYSSGKTQYSYVTKRMLDIATSGTSSGTAVIKITSDQLTDSGTTYTNNNLTSNSFVLEMSGVGLLHENQNYEILSGGTKGFRLINGVTLGINDFIVLLGAFISPEPDGYSDVMAALNTEINNRSTVDASLQNQINSLTGGTGGGGTLQSVVDAGPTVDTSIYFQSNPNGFFNRTEYGFRIDNGFLDYNATITGSSKATLWLRGGDVYLESRLGQDTDNPSRLSLNPQEDASTPAIVVGGSGGGLSRTEGTGRISIADGINPQDAVTKKQLDLINQVNLGVAGSGINFKNGKLSLGTDITDPTFSNGALTGPLYLLIGGTDTTIPHTQFVLDTGQSRMSNYAANNAFLAQVGVMTNDGESSAGITVKGTNGEFDNNIGIIGDSYSVGVLMYTAPDGTGKTGLNITIGTDTGTNTQTGMIVSDAVQGKGFEEAGDYSANKTDYSYVTKKMLNVVTSGLTGKTNSVGLLVNRIPFGSGNNTLIDSSNLLWDDNNVKLTLTGGKQTISFNNTFSNKNIELGIFDFGSRTIRFKDVTYNKTLMALVASPSSGGTTQLGIGDIDTIPSESQLYVYGGATGANFDLRGDVIKSDECNIDLEGSDWDTLPNSIGLSYFGTGYTKGGTFIGLPKKKMGILRWQNVNNAVIATVQNIPIRFGINDIEIININSSGMTFQADFSSGYTLRSIVDKAYVDNKTVDKISNSTDTYTSTAAATNIITLSQAEYDAIVTKNANTLYFII